MYKTVSPAWSVTSETLHNSSQNIDSHYDYYFPPQPKGVIVFFHGTSGSADDWLKVENFRMWQDAVADGYAVVATESIDRSNGAQWNTTLLQGANPDVLNVANGLATFVQRGYMTNQTPLFSVARPHKRDHIATYLTTAHGGRRLIVSATRSVCSPENLVVWENWVDSYLGDQFRWSATIRSVRALPFSRSVTTDARNA